MSDPTELYWEGVSKIKWNKVGAKQLTRSNRKTEKKIKYNNSILPHLLINNSYTVNTDQWFKQMFYKDIGNMEERERGEYKKEIHNQ